MLDRRWVKFSRSAAATRQLKRMRENMRGLGRAGAARAMVNHVLGGQG